MSGHPILTYSHPIGIMTGDNPLYPASAPGGNEGLKRELSRIGAPFEEVWGKYGGVPERSLIIHGLPREHLYSLGQRYGQESVIHSEGGQRHFLYTNGPHTGQMHVGNTHTHWTPEQAPPEDNYTTIPGLGHVRLDFDFNSHHSAVPANEPMQQKLAAGVGKHEIGYALHQTLTKVLDLAAPNLGDVAVQKSEGSPAVADEKKTLTVREALHEVHKLGKAQIEAYEKQCIALRKAETEAMEKVAPPGFDEKAMHELKRKYGVKSAFKIAWAAHNKHGGDHKKAELAFKAEPSSDEPDEGPKCKQCGEGVDEGDSFCGKYCRREYMADEKFHADRDEGLDRSIGDGSLSDPSKEKSYGGANNLGKAGVTDGGMGQMASAPAPNLGEMALAEVKPAKHLEVGPFHGQGKQLGPSVQPITKNYGNPAAYGPGGASQQPAPPMAMSEDDKLEAYAKGELKIAKGEMCKACGMAKGASHDCDMAESYAKGEYQPAGSMPESPKPKVGVLPGDKKPKEQVRDLDEGSGGQISKGKMAKAGVGVKLPMPKAPKAGVAAKPPAPAGGKPPAQGAGQPNMKAEKGLRKDMGTGSAPSLPTSTTVHTPSGTSEVQSAGARFGHAGAPSLGAGGFGGQTPASSSMEYAAAGIPPAKPASTPMPPKPQMAMKAELAKAGPPRLPGVARGGSVPNPEVAGLINELKPKAKPPVLPNEARFDVSDEPVLGKMPKAPAGVQHKVQLGAGDVLPIGLPKLPGVAGPAGRAGAAKLPGIGGKSVAEHVPQQMGAPIVGKTIAVQSLAKPKLPGMGKAEDKPKYAPGYDPKAAAYEERIKNPARKIKPKDYAPGYDPKAAAYEERTKGKK